MNAHMRWSRVLVVVGSIAMLIGAIDPMEGSLIILPGSGMVALGTHLGGSRRRAFLFWLWVFILIAVGVGALFGLSALGGIGGNTGLSGWWGLIILPYPLGWLLGFVGIILRFINFLRARGKKAEY